MLLEPSGLLCFIHAAEPQHADAVAFFQTAPWRLTHNYVIAEFVALAQARGLPREAVLAFVADIQSSPLVEVVYVDETLHRGALTFLQERLDKNWSLCDAVSFLLMKRYGFLEALTTDGHFEQADFVRLLAP